MSIEITILVSVVSVAFAVYFGLKSNRRNDNKDLEERVARETKIDIKLDDISSDVKDIKFDMSATKKKVDDIDKRLVIVEQSAKSAHHRIDEIIGKESVSNGNQ